jgi:DNA-binding beta-propeller fold protein YncE
VSWRILVYSGGPIALLLATVSGSKQAVEPPIEQTAAAAIPPANYAVVHGWPELPSGAVFDEVSSVAVDAQSNVLVLARDGREWPDSDILDQTPIANPTVLVLDGRTGRPVRRWGEKQFALPHSVTVDPDNNVWVTDVALHQVFKFSPDGKLLLTLGERGVAGTDRSHFNRPTDVAVARDGSFYISDGYGNSRILMFGADAQFRLQWGKKGTGPGEFDLPHGIAVDDAGRVLVVDRENARIQVFDRNGNYQTQWKGAPFTNPQDIAVGSGGVTFVTDLYFNNRPPDRSGIIVMRLDGTLLGRFGRYGNYDGQFLVAHGVAVGKGGEVYVADFTGRRVQKFLPER